MCSQTSKSDWRRAVGRRSCLVSPPQSAAAEAGFRRGDVSKSIAKRLLMSTDQRWGKMRDLPRIHRRLRSDR
jgi:hypothetical protein